MSDNYKDIIHLPHKQSNTRPHMSVADRAAQFAPFSALTGYEAAIRETGRLTDSRIELDETAKAALNETLRGLMVNSQPTMPVKITYFRPDNKKVGGAYVTTAGYIKKICDIERVVTLTNGMEIFVEDIFRIEV